MRKKEVRKTCVDFILLDAVQKPGRPDDIYIATFLQRRYLHYPYNTHKLAFFLVIVLVKGLLLSAMQIVLGAALFV